MNLQKDPDVPPQINIVPLIDVVFSLLTFFILSTLFLSNSESVPVNLPTATSGEITQTSERITITITADGKIRLNRQLVTLETLPTQLLALKENRQEVIAVIHSDETVDFGLAVAVMDQVRQVQGMKLAIATRRPDETQK